MAYPISVQKNNYYDNKKDSSIETPMWLAKRIYEIIMSVLIYKNWSHEKNSFDIVCDIGCGNGNLTKPFIEKKHRDYFYKDKIIKRYIMSTGYDIKNYNYPVTDNSYFHQKDFLNIWPEIKKCREETENVGYNEPLVLCNPPFNNKNNKRKLLPELFLKEIFKIFGEKAKIVLFVPMGFRLNQRKKSARWQWLKNTEAEITSIMSLPIDTFEGVLFHVEILFLNIPGLKPHYWIED